MLWSTRSQSPRTPMEHFRMKGFYCYIMQLTERTERDMRSLCSHTVATTRLFPAFPSLPHCCKSLRFTSQLAASCNNGQRWEPPGSQGTGPLSSGGKSPIVGPRQRGEGFSSLRVARERSGPKDILVQGTSTMDRITLQNEKVPTFRGLPTIRRHVC